MEARGRVDKIQRWMGGVVVISFTWLSLPLSASDETRATLPRSEKVIFGLVGGGNTVFFCLRDTFQQRKIITVNKQ
jgi:hypothetical protein